MQQAQSVRAANHSCLSWLLDPIGRQRFFDDYWERKTLVVKRDSPQYFDNLFSLGEVDRVITTLDRRYPDIVLKNADARVAEDEYTLSGGAIDVAKLYQLFERGSTISLAFLDTVVPALTRFCRSLENEFSFPFQTNVYVTPPGAQGARPHYDTHDVFVLQVSGSKQWTIFDTPVESPLPDQDYDDQVHSLGAPTQRFELQAGDLAYIPRGVGHEARSTDTVSLHITAGVLRYTWAELLLELVSEASLRNPALRKALPPGFARSGFDLAQARATAARLFREAENSADFDAVLEGFADKFLARCPPVLDGQLAQLSALDRLSIDSVVSARQGVVLRLDTTGEALRVECYGRVMTFPPQASEAVRFALSNPHFAVRALPGNLDRAGKLTVVRRLIREGLLVADDV